MVFGLMIKEHQDIIDYGARMLIYIATLEEIDREMFLEIVSMWRDWNNIQPAYDPEVYPQFHKSSIFISNMFHQIITMNNKRKK